MKHVIPIWNNYLMLSDRCTSTQCTYQKFVRAVRRNCTYNFW